MHLEVHRDAPALEALDQMHLPRRAVEIDFVAVEARDEDAELALVARRGEGRAAHVVVEVEVLVLNPRSGAGSRGSPGAAA